MDPKPSRCTQCEAGRQVASAPSRGSRTTDCEEGAPGGHKEKKENYLQFFFNKILVLSVKREKKSITRRKLKKKKKVFIFWLLDVD